MGELNPCGVVPRGCCPLLIGTAFPEAPVDKDSNIGISDNGVCHRRTWRLRVNWMPFQSATRALPVPRRQDCLAKPNCFRIQQRSEPYG